MKKHKADYLISFVLIMMKISTDWSLTQKCVGYQKEIVCFYNLFDSVIELLETKDTYLIARKPHHITECYRIPDRPLYIS